MHTKILFFVSLLFVMLLSILMVDFVGMLRKYHFIFSQFNLENTGIHYVPVITPILVISGYKKII